MKKFYIVHGWDGSPEDKPLVWLSNKLKQEGHEANNLEMPNPEEPEIGSWVNKIRNVIDDIDQDTFLVGHSVGGQAVLRFLETLPDNKNIGGTILVAPWMQLDRKTLEEEGQEVVEIAKPWMETPIDFNKVKNISGKILAFFSTNDPYVDTSQGQIFKDKLNTKIFILENRGHFDEYSGIEDLPEVLDEIKKIT